ncbi:hypothetical protein LPJ70_006367 [Coemansia sp. RSA 2708]|nr:hypothetical protein LPJ70_006367 [Coemansia sp. RSA 2708]
MKCTYMLISSALAAAISPSLPLVSVPDVPSVPSPKACDAQNVLDNCLSVQGKVLAMCSYSDWACKCQAQQSIAGCFNNCPSDEARAANEGQVTVFCNAAMRAKEEDEKSSSKAAKTRTTASAVPTSSSVNDAEDEDANPAVGKPRRGDGGHGKSKARASDTLASFSADSAANALTPLMLAAAWLALAI